jgi:hypothetical protein
LRQERATVHFKITQGCDALKESRCFEIKMSVAARGAYFLSNLGKLLPLCNRRAGKQKACFVIDAPLTEGSDSNSFFNCTITTPDVWKIQIVKTVDQNMHYKNQFILFYCFHDFLSV